MKKSFIVFGKQMYFAREGTTVDTVTVSASAKPDADPTSNWEHLGNNVKLSIQNNSTYKKQYSDAPGKSVLKRVHCTRRELTGTAEFDEINRAFLESMLMLPGPTTAGTATRPMDGTGLLTGWFKVQLYDQSDAAAAVIDVYAQGHFENLDLTSGEEVKPVLVLEVIWSDLMSADIKNIL